MSRYWKDEERIPRSELEARVAELGDANATLLEIRDRLKARNAELERELERLRAVVNASIRDQAERCGVADLDRLPRAALRTDSASDTEEVRLLRQRLRELEDEIRALLECPVCRVKPESIAGHEHLERLRELLDG